MTELCTQIENFGKGIGSASRYKIIEALFKEPKTVGQLVKITKLSQPAVSQHLKTLKTCGLVKDERCGQEVIYSLHNEHFLKLLKNLISRVSSAKK